MIIGWCLLSTAALLVGAATATYYVSVQDSVALSGKTQQQQQVQPARVRLGSISMLSAGDDGVGALSFISGDASVSEYPSESMALDAATGSLYFIAETTNSATIGNYTLRIDKLAVGSGAITTVYRLQPVAAAGGTGAVSPQLSSLTIDTARRWLYFCRGKPGPSATLISRLHLDTGAAETVFDVSSVPATGQFGYIMAAQLDTASGALYASTTAGILRMDTATMLADTNATAVRLSSVYAGLSAPYAFRIDSARGSLVFLQYGDAGVAAISRPLGSLNSTAGDVVVFNASMAPADGTQITGVEGFHVDATRLLLVGGPAIYSVPYPGDGSNRVALLLNVTATYPEVMRVYSIVGDGSGVVQPSPFSVAITVLTSVAIAAALTSAAVSSVGAGGGAGASSSASASAGGATSTSSTATALHQTASVAAQHTTTLLVALITQLQFAVTLGQLGGAMPAVYDQFVAGVAWVWLGFKGASFGLAAPAVVAGAQDGLHRFAQMLEMSRNNTFASVMIILILVACCVLVVYAVAHVLAVKVAPAADSKVTDTRRQTINRLACKFVGHVFLLSYVTLCTVSVNQLTMDDAAAGFFAGVVLVLVCTTALIILYLAVYPPALNNDSAADFKTQLLTAASTFSSAMYQKFLQAPLCNDFVDTAHFTGFVLMSVKYFTGMFTGAVQTVPVLQIVLILVLLLVEACYVAYKRPYKVAILWYLHLTSAAVRITCVLIKLGLAASSNGGANEAAGAAMLALNGALILIMIVGIVAGVVMKAEAVKRFLFRSTAPLPVKSVANSAAAVDPEAAKTVAMTESSPTKQP